MSVYTGADSKAMWAVEATYGTMPESFPKVFGRSLQLESVSIGKQLSVSSGIGDRTPGAIRRGMFEGQLSVSFTMQDDQLDWLSVVYPDTATANTWKEGDSVKSIAIQHTFGGKTQTFLGCVCTGMDLEAGISSPTVQVTLSFDYGMPPIEGTGTALAPVLTGKAATFAEATLAVGAWTSCTIDSVRISTRTGLAPVGGIGSYNACDYHAGLYEHTASISHVATSNQRAFETYKDDPVSGTLTVAVDGGNTITFALTDMLVDTIGFSVSDADPVEESIDMLIRSISVSKAGGS